MSTANVLTSIINIQSGDPNTRIGTDQVSAAQDGRIVELFDPYNTGGDPVNVWDPIDPDGDPDTVDDVHAVFLVPSRPFFLAAEAAGGLVTGMAWIYDEQTEAESGIDGNLNGEIEEDVYHQTVARLYAVTDAETNTSTRPLVASVGGGLIEVMNVLGTDPELPTAALQSPEFASELLTRNFQGLAAGPPHVEGGVYSETLFAIDADGVIPVSYTHLTLPTILLV